MNVNELFTTMYVCMYMDPVKSYSPDFVISASKSHASILAKYPINDHMFSEYNSTAVHVKIIPVWYYVSRIKYSLCILFVYYGENLHLQIALYCPLF